MHCAVIALSCPFDSEFEALLLSLVSMLFITALQKLNGSRWMVYKL